MQSQAYCRLCYLYEKMAIVVENLTGNKRLQIPNCTIVVASQKKFKNANNRGNTRIHYRLCLFDAPDQKVTSLMRIHLDAK